MLFQRFGILGILGVLLIVVWTIGFFTLGMHSGHFHILLGVGILCLAIQGVRRLAA